MKKKILFKSFFVLMFAAIALFLTFGMVVAEGDKFKVEFNEKEFKIVTEGIDKNAIDKGKEVVFEVIVPEKKQVKEVKASDKVQTVKDNKFTLKVDQDYKLTVTFEDAKAKVEKLKPIQIAAIVVLVISILIPAIMALVKKIQNKKAEKKMMEENVNGEEVVQDAEVAEEQATEETTPETTEAETTEETK